MYHNYFHASARGTGAMQAAVAAALWKRAGKLPPAEFGQCRDFSGHGEDGMGLREGGARQGEGGGGLGRREESMLHPMGESEGLVCSLR